MTKTLFGLLEVGDRFYVPNFTQSIEWEKLCNENGEACGIDYSCSHRFAWSDVVEVERECIECDGGCKDCQWREPYA